VYVGNFQRPAVRALVVGGECSLVETEEDPTFLCPRDIHRDATVHFEFDPVGRSLAVGMVEDDLVHPTRTFFENLPDPMFVTPYWTVQQPATEPGLSPTVQLTIECEDE
jgi:hypothetical protein